MLVVMICITLILCSGLIAYAIALPRFQVTEHEADDSFLINDRFKGKIFYCSIIEGTYVCAPLAPQESEVFNINK